MTHDECHALIRRLMAAYGGDWDEDRIALWAETLLPLEYGYALTGIKQMTATERFPTIAAFFDAARVPEVPVQYVPELPQRADREAVVISIEYARQAIRRAKGETA